MTTTIEVMKQALKALEQARDDIDGWGSYADQYFKDKWDLAGDIDRVSLQITALRAEIERLEKVEPVAWMLGCRLYSNLKDAEWAWRNDEAFDNVGYIPTPLYLHPAPAEIEELRKDAARYRWLRKRDVIDWDNMPSVPEFPYEWVGWDDTKLILDATIDAAMEKQP